MSSNVIHQAPSARRQASPSNLKVLQQAHVRLISAE